MKTHRSIDRETYDVVIIGSGMGGLVCAANLVHAGRSVVVLEQHYIPGGATSMFERKGFRFEAGGHRISGIQSPDGALRKLLDKIGCNIETKPIDPVYVVKMAGKTLVASRDIKVYQENVKELFPSQHREIEIFFKDLLNFVKGSNYVRSTKRVNPFLLASKYHIFIRYAKKSLHQFMQDHFDDRQIILMLTALGNYTTLPHEEQSMINFANMWATHHLGEGMSMVKGGTTALVSTLVDYIDNNGGVVAVGNPVVKILTEGHKAIGVLTQKGQQVKAKVVVSNASNEQTYLKMLDQNLLKDQFIHKVETQKQSSGLFQVYLGIEERDGIGLENVTTFILGEETGTNQKDFFERVYSWDLEAITSAGVITVEGKENSPQGYRSINISSLIPYHHPQNWFIHGTVKREYQHFKKQIAEKIIQNMSRYIPDLRERIVVMDTATPLTLERYTLATKGGLQGLAHTREQSGRQRGSLNTPIENLYQAGQYVFPGAGIVTVTMCGNMCADLILQNHF
jgi:phytoene dehydrogenase-like protein